MKKIKVGFSRPRKSNPLSEAIMFLDKSNYSHIYMAFHSDSLDRDLVYQANRHGIYFIGMQRFVDNNITVKFYEIELEDDVYALLLKKCVDMSGLSYGVLQIIGMGLMKALQYVGIKAKNPIKDKNYVCSELIATLLKECLKYNIPQDMEEITPTDLDKILIGMGMKEQTA